MACKMSAVQIRYAPYTVNTVLDMPVLFGSMLDAESIFEYSDIDLAIWGLPSDLYGKAGCDVIIYILSPASCLLPIFRTMKG